MFAPRRGTASRGGGTSAEAKPAKSLDQSMLDIVLADSKALRAKISMQDQRKMDEYLDGVRSLEQRIQAIESQAKEAAASEEAKKEFKSSPLMEVKIPADPDVDERIKLMFDLIALAYQSDTTRVATFQVASFFTSSRAYAPLGIKEQHHAISHHFGKPDLLAKLAKVDKYHNEMFAGFLDRLKSLNEGNGTLLDNCIIVYGSGMSDGSKHDYARLPTIVAGKGGGTIRTGRYVQQSAGRFSDLLVGVLARAGAPVPSLGDSTKMLPDLS